ncbi:hypothetical protein FKW77_007200 [Venturia effusa]|uniref:Prolyl 4-hydroxylase alpha subunit Fe(2+) 2OG dioxygenase domain-containing protein n=1 Tax=Venturia effusa TaxID=50376 RepID=A0A517LCK2_9PEZI|nr:hypothetical protein FKW77_007200 [Venturia effusa]
MHVSSSESSEPEDLSESVSSTTNDVPVEVSELKDRLYACLSEVKSEGSFSSYQHASMFPNPGLYIKKLARVVPLPLSDHDAREIAANSALAPFGKKDETVVDTTVRNTWEINASEFEFRNPAWQPFFKQITDKAVKQLGVDSDAIVEAQSYKLLLYEEGAFFKAHKDSEKVLGMFASLIICLPSCSGHTGGDVCLTHGTEKRVLSTSKTSGYDLSVLAWYSDVKHEIKPITSGYRLVLTFNLIAASRKANSAATLNERRLHLQSLLHVWREDFQHVEKLAYILEHQYTASSLGAQNLKRQDRALSDYLENVCGTNRFHLFFAQITKTEMADDADDDEDQEGTSLDHIVLPCGLIVASHGSIETEDIIQSDIFDRDADSEDEGEWTGNENMPGILRYHNTAAIIIPEEKLFQFFRSNVKTASPGGKNLLNYICKLADESLDGPKLKDLAVRLALKAFENDYSYRYYSDSYLYKQEQCDFYSTILDLAMKLPDLELYGKILASGVSSYGPGANAMFVMLAKYFNGKSDQDRPDWQLYLGPVLSNINALPELQSAFSKFKMQLAKEEDQNSFKDWAKGEIDQRLSALDTLSYPYHLPMVVELIESRDPEWVSATMLPIITRLGTGEFIRKLLASLDDKGENAEVKESIANIYRHLIGNCSFELISGPKGFPSFPEARRFDRANMKELFELVAKGLTFGLKEEGIKIIEKHVGDLCGHSGPELAHDDVIYIITTFVTFATSHQGVVSDALAARLFKCLLKRALYEFVQRKPSQPCNWTQKKKGCGSCKDCEDFDRFLLDPVATTQRFRTNLERRSHLSSYAGEWFITETDRRGSPHTLVITKTNREYEHDIKIWTKQFHDMPLLWKDIQTPYMKRVLGPEDYAKLVELRSLRKREYLSPAPLPSMTSQTLNARQPGLNAETKRKADTELNQAAGTKKKVEIIELDSD